MASEEVTYCEECGECDRIGAHTPWCSREPDRDPKVIAEHRRFRP